MKNRGSTTILTNMVRVHSRNIYTKFEANPCSSLREVKKVKSKKFTTDDDHNNNDDDDDGHRVIARVTLTH